MDEQAIAERSHPELQLVVDALRRCSEDWRQRARGKRLRGPLFATLRVFLRIRADTSRQLADRLEGLPPHAVILVTGGEGIVGSPAPAVENQAS